MGAIKVKMRVHDAEFEAEGSREDVNALLEVWWSKVQATSGNEDQPAGQPHQRDVSPPRKSPRSRAGKQLRKRGGDSADSQGFDANQLANDIKQLPNFSRLADNILHRKDRYNKVALVCMLADQPLTSGDIHRVLTALRIKIDLPGVSKVLASHSTKFLHTSPRKLGGTIAAYELTSSARQELQKVIDAAD